VWKPVPQLEDVVPTPPNCCADAPAGGYLEGADGNALRQAIAATRFHAESQVGPLSEAAGERGNLGSVVPVCR
jgi:hypothetical protein